MSFSTKWRKPASPCYARLRFGISQQQLADILGVSRSLVTMMERGKRKLPRGPGDIYLRLCRKADELPWLGILPVKRGRKPTASGSSLLPVTTVSNYNLSNFDTKKSWVKQNKWVDLAHKPTPSQEAMAEKAIKEPGCTAFTDKLKEQKNRLLHSYALLEIKKELMEFRQIELSARLEGMNKALEYMKPLEESLPDGRLKRRIKILNNFNSFRQLKLSRELKKWGVPELLKTELQMNCIKRQIGLTDEWIGALTTQAVVRPMQGSYVLAGSSLAV